MLKGLYAGRRPGPAPDEHVLVLTFDGKGIVMRPDALRPATAKAAAAGKNKLATRLSPGEKHGRKRMAELACVYDAAPVPREPGDVITPPGTDRKERSRGPQAAGKWLTAHNDPYPIQFGSGDWITVVTRTTGTFTEEMVLPDGTVVSPTGKAFDLDFGQTSKWQGDQLITISAFWDSALQAKQIGLG